MLKEKVVQFIHSRTNVNFRPAVYFRNRFSGLQILRGVRAKGVYLSHGEGLHACKTLTQWTLSSLCVFSRGIKLRSHTDTLLALKVPYVYIRYELRQCKEQKAEISLTKSVEVEGIGECAEVDHTTTSCFARSDH